MRPRPFLAILLTALALLLAACGGGGGEQGKPTPLTVGDREITPIAGNSELVVGPNRFTIAFIDAENSPFLGEADNSVHLRFSGPDGSPKGEQDARFVWAIPDETGVWVADVDFDQPGQWNAEAVLRRGEEETKASFSFTVLERGQAPMIGDPAPPTNNLTLGQEPNIKRVSTDENPDLALYQMTVTEALQAGKPFVVVFATPAFCQTRFCGPILDNVKSVRPEFADRVNFINIEPYELDAEGLLVFDQQGNMKVAQPMLDWRLQTEPWVFVVGADGRIAARFEGTASPEELREAIQKALG